MRFQAEAKMQIIDTDSGNPVDLISCACENQVFYFTSSGDQICSCCYMTESEAEKAQLKEP